jgi:hypothetical protein
MKRSRTGLPPANAVISPKTQAVLEIAEANGDLSLQSHARFAVMAAADDQFSRKAIRRKIDELGERGYLEPRHSVLAPPYPIIDIVLTDRGRAVLKLCRYQASLKQSA